MTPLVIIQARLGSKRLPGKVLRPLLGRPVICHVVSRAEALGVPVVVAVPYPDLDAFADYVPLVVAPPVEESDVLGRYAATAAMLPWADPIIRVTGDCPMWDPEEGQRVLAAYQSSAYDFASNVIDGYTDGEDVELFSRGLLHIADQRATDPDDREHVTPWMRRHVECLHVGSVSPQRTKRSLDTDADLRHIQGLHL